MSRASELVDAAYLAGREGRYPEAIEIARAAVDADPTNERAHTILAHALDHSGRPAEAAEVIGQILASGPARADYLYYLAVLLRKAGRPEEAVPLAIKFVQLQPQSSDAHAHLGVVLVAAGRPQEALGSLRRAGELNPTSALLRYNLALTLIQLGQDAEAIRVLREMLAMEPGFALGRVALGEALLRSRVYESAVQEARTAIESDSDCAGAHLLLAHALADHAANGGVGIDPEEAERHVRLALTLDPSSSVGHGMLGFALQEKGEFESAIAEFELSAQLTPQQGVAFYGLATSRKYTDDDNGFLDRLEGVLKGGGVPPAEAAYLHYALGKVSEDRREFEAAMGHFDAANEIVYDIRARLNPFDQAALERSTSRLIQTFDRSFFEDRRRLGSPAETPLLVVGMMRSGTTLVEQILSSHPSVWGGGELMFWRDHAAKGFNAILKTPKVPPLNEIKEDYLALLKSIGGESPRVTDKMPQNTVYLGLIHILFPEARIVHVRRHPVDTCLSIYATPYVGSPDFAHHRGNMVYAFKQHLRLMEHWRSVLPSDRFTDVDYEELVSDSEKSTRRLIAFAGLGWDGSCLRHEKNERSVKTPSRWQVRQPIFRSSVARWKHYEPWLGEFDELLSPGER